jgi:hypothetical protein
MRRVLPALVALLAGLIVLLDYFLENPLLDALGGHLLEGAIILGACALILGLWNLLATHERRIRRREPGWATSAVILVAALGSLVLGIVAWQTPAWTWFYRYLLFPLEASAGALLAFAVANAAVRTWRFGTLEGSLLLLAGLPVLLGSLPLGGDWPAGLGALRDWIVAVPVLAAVRGILLGVALGIMATGLRVLFWIDRPYG